MKIPSKSPIFLALLCALGVHTVLFTDGGHRLQAAIIESDTSSHAEAHLVAGEKTLTLQTGVTASEVSSISGTLDYDDTSIIIYEPRSDIGEVTVTETDLGKHFVLTFDRRHTTTKGDTLITWTMTPVIPETHVVNLSAVTLHMTDGDARLTTEGTGEF